MDEEEGPSGNDVQNSESEICREEYESQPRQDVAGRREGRAKRGEGREGRKGPSERRARKCEGEGSERGGSEEGTHEGRPLVDLHAVVEDESAVRVAEAVGCGEGASGFATSRSEGGEPE